MDELHAVSLSGGKDSTYMTLEMVKRNMPIDLVLAADPGMEFPEMYEHLSKVDDFLFRERGMDKDKHPIKKVEWWTATDCWYFVSYNGGPLDLVDIREHYWGDVPFIEFINNEERIGDFEGVVSIIDAWN